MIIKDKNIKSSNGYNIEYNLYIPDDMKKIIIAIHGFGGDKNSSVIERLAIELYKYNIGLIAFDLPGHGESEVDGKYFTVENSLKDFIEIENYVKQKYHNIPIGVFATSYGAYITLLRIGLYKDDFSNIILRCPAINMYKIFCNNILGNLKNILEKQGYCTLGYERKIDIYNQYVEQLKEYNVDKILTKVSNKTNILIIHGTEDNMAPIEDSIALANKYRENIKLKKIFGADHRFKKDGEVDKIINFSKEFFEN